MHLCISYDSLTVNSHCSPKQHYFIGLCSGESLYFLCGRHQNTVLYTVYSIKGKLRKQKRDQTKHRCV